MSRDLRFDAPIWVVLESLPMPRRPKSAPCADDDQGCDLGTTVPSMGGYRTRLGSMLIGDIEEALDGRVFSQVRGRVTLIFTSPPFPLIRKKRYGNSSGTEYVDWLRRLGPRLAEMLAPDGSLVMELGNTWVQGSPTMSTLPLEALLAFKEAAGLHLCQYVVCHNPARLPTPAAWVTVRRMRLKDSFTHVWWMARSETPKADNRRVLVPYGADMKRLLRRKKYNAGRRPSGHVISAEGFLTDHGGAIAPSVLAVDEATGRVPDALLQFTGTAWDTTYRDYCAAHALEAHPARMQQSLAAFFIQFLTEPGDLVVDPFAGSNTTGAVAETLHRRWLAVERDADYARGSLGRFQGVPVSPLPTAARVGL